MKLTLIAVCAIVSALHASPADVPSFAEAIDKCESLWKDGRYDAVLSYINQLDSSAPEYVPAKVLVAMRDEHFGEQFEDAASALRDLTNRIHRVICEVNPELILRLGCMAEDADSVARLLERAGQGKEYRKVNNDPRKRSGRPSSAPFLRRSFRDLPFLVPSVYLSGCHRDVEMGVNTRTVCKVAEGRQLVNMIFFDDKVSCRKKVEMLDDYVSAIVSGAGVKGLVEQFDDDFVRLNGYGALRALRRECHESKQCLMTYLEQSFERGRPVQGVLMAVWALLQFAHDDPEVASYLRTLPSKVGDRSPRTLEYLKLAIKHLDEGCPRHFVSAPTSPQKIENGAGGN